jgi:RNA polymerase sigma-70 factor, ECF subfamily
VESSERSKNVLRKFSKRRCRDRKTLVPTTSPAVRMPDYLRPAAVTRGRRQGHSRRACWCHWNTRREAADFFPSLRFRLIFQHCEHAVSLIRAARRGGGTQARLLLRMVRVPMKSDGLAALTSDTSAAPRCYTSSVRDALDIDALSHQYGAMVLRRCRRLLRDEDEALDACQDVFVRLIEHRHRLDGIYPSSLLYRIATNVCLNRIRDRGRVPVSREEHLLASIAQAGAPGGRSEARLLLDWLFGRHPESSRTIAVLHYVDGLTFEEVARQTGLSVSGVRRRLRLLRKTLADIDRHA